MTKAIVFIAAFIIAPLCLAFILIIAKWYLKISKLEQVSPASSQSENIVAAEVFKGSSFTTPLCALIGSFVMNLETMDALSLTPKTRGLELSAYARAVAIHFLLGLLAGNASVKMWKSMRITDASTSSKGWIRVSLLIPLVSFGIFLLYSCVVPIKLRDAVTTGIWVCLSTPAVLFGGYAAATDNGNGTSLIHPAEDPVLMSHAYSPRLYFLQTAYFVIFFGFVGISYFLVSGWRSSSVTESGVLLVTAAFLLASLIWAFLIYFHMALIFCHVIDYLLSRVQRCWWKAFLIFGVPSGIFAFTLKFAWPIATPLISFVFAMAKFGTLGPLFIYFFVKKGSAEAVVEGVMVLIAIFIEITVFFSRNSVNIYMWISQ